MEKQKISIPIGDSKALIFEADPANKQDMDFAKRCQDVAATKPQTLQEFFTRLDKAQQQPPPKMVRKIGRRL